MRVLFIHDGSGPIRGSEKVALDLMLGLKSFGYEWQVLTNHSEFYLLTRDHGIPSNLISFTRLFVDGWRLNDFILIVRAFVTARNILKNQSIDLIHINNGGACQWAIVAAAVERIPSVVHLHAPWSRKMRILLGIHHADRIVGVSQSILNRIQNDPSASKRTRIIYNGIKPCLNTPKADRGKYRQLLGIGSGQFCVGMFGVLIPEKRPMDGIEAIRTLKSRYGECCMLLIVGDGPERAALEAAALELPVIFLGQRDDVLDLMTNACDAVILPSEIEAFSLVLLEAAICGVPRIASMAGGNTESIIDLDDGLLFPLGDTVSLATKIDLLISNPKLAIHLTSRAKERVLSEFSQEKFITRFDGLFKETAAMAPISIFKKLLSALRSNFSLLAKS